MNELSLNEFLLKGRVASDTFRAKGQIETALLILQITSLIALRHVPAPHKVTCQTCSRQLRAGQEIEFYHHTGMCYTCDSAYVESMEELYEQD